MHKATSWVFVKDNVCIVIVIIICRKFWIFDRYREAVSWHQHSPLANWKVSEVTKVCMCTMLSQISHFFFFVQEWNTMKVRGSFWTSHHNHLHHFSPSSSRKKRKRRRRKNRRGLKGLVSTKRSTVSVQTQILILWRIRSNTNSRTASQFSSTITFCESPKLNKINKKSEGSKRVAAPL